MPVRSLPQPTRDLRRRCHRKSWRATPRAARRYGPCAWTHRREIAGESDLTLASLDEVVLRYEYGKAVPGFVAVLKAADEASAMLPAVEQSTAADRRR